MTFQRKLDTGDLSGDDILLRDADRILASWAYGDRSGGTVQSHSTLVTKRGGFTLNLFSINTGKWLNSFMVLGLTFVTIMSTFL